MEDKKRYGLLLVAWLIGLTIWRLASVIHTNPELSGDEAQYWIWSLTPDWGYYSKPPVVAWAIWLGTHLFGDSELAIRSMTFVIYPLAAWFIFLTVRRLFRDGSQPADRIAFWSALLFASLPMTSLGSVLITTDAPLILAWSMAAYFTVAALETGRWADWLKLGLAIGFGLMSKYSMLFYGLAFLVYVLVSRERWSLFKDPKPYVAAALAFLLVVPNIAWNAHNDFVSFHHTAEISELDRSLFHPKSLMEFFFGQFLVFGPVTAGWLLALSLRPRRWFADDRLRMTALFTLVPVAAFMVLSLLSRAFANWVAFAYVSGAAFTTAALLMRSHRAWLISAIAVNLALGVAVYHYHDIARGLGLQLTRKTDPYARITGFRQLGTEVARRLAEHPSTRFLTDERTQYSLIRYYARPYSAGGKYLNISGLINNQFAMTDDVKEDAKGEFLFISPVMTDERVRKWFGEVQPQPPIVIRVHPDDVREYRVWLVKDYLKS
jgi:4-amino-4-deoxy-L-arabinose transferase-like glycosyltransferase